MTATTITEQVAELEPFGRLEIRHSVDAAYTVILEADRIGRRNVTFRVHVERRNTGNLGTARGLCERRGLTDLDEARAYANRLWTSIRNGDSRP